MGSPGASMEWKNHIIASASSFGRSQVTKWPASRNEDGFEPGHLLFHAARILDGLAGIIGRWKEAYPAANLRIVEGLAPLIISGLREGSINLGVAPEPLDFEGYGRFRCSRSRSS